MQNRKPQQKKDHKSHQDQTKNQWPFRHNKNQNPFQLSNDLVKQTVNKDQQAQDLKAYQKIVDEAEAQRKQQQMQFEKDKAIKKEQKKILENSKAAQRKSDQDEICAICMQSVHINDKATLNNCEHFFCMPCITEWLTEKVNQCALCKKRVQTVTNQANYEQIKIAQKDNYSDSYGDYDDSDDDSDDDDDFTHACKRCVNCYDFICSEFTDKFVECIDCQDEIICKHCRHDELRKVPAHRRKDEKDFICESCVELYAEGGIVCPVTYPDISPRTKDLLEDAHENYKQKIFSMADQVKKDEQEKVKQSKNIQSGQINTASNLQTSSNQQISTIRQPIQTSNSRSISANAQSRQDNPIESNFQINRPSNGYGPVNLTLQNGQQAKFNQLLDTIPPQNDVTSSKTKSGQASRSVEPVNRNQTQIQVSFNNLVQAGSKVKVNVTIQLCNQSDNANVTANVITSEIPKEIPQVEPIQPAYELYVRRVESLSPPFLVYDKMPTELFKMAEESTIRLNYSNSNGNILVETCDNQHFKTVWNYSICKYTRINKKFFVHK